MGQHENEFAEIWKHGGVYRNERYGNNAMLLCLLCHARHLTNWITQAQFVSAPPKNLLLTRTIVFTLTKLCSFVWAMNFLSKGFRLMASLGCNLVAKVSYVWTDVDSGYVRSSSSAAAALVDGEATKCRSLSSNWEARHSSYSRPTRLSLTAVLTLSAHSTVHTIYWGAFLLDSSRLKSWVFCPLCWACNVFISPRKLYCAQQQYDSLLLSLAALEGRAADRRQRARKRLGGVEHENENEKSKGEKVE